MKPCTLVVDDDDDVRQVIAHSLEIRAGSHVLQVGNGVQAIGLATRNQPNAILLDVIKAGMDSPATLHKLKAARSTRHFAVPVEMSLEDHLEWVTERLSTLGRGQTISTESWFAEQPSSAAQQGFLLALLEMARRGTVLLHQADHLGPIVIEVAKPVPVAFSPRSALRSGIGEQRNRKLA